MARAITDTLRDIAHGAFMDEASIEMNELVRAVDEQGKGGELTMKVKVKPAGNKSGALNVSYEVICKKPKGERPSAIMWGTPEGDLLAKDPRQQSLDLRDVTQSAKPELKNVRSAAA